MLTPATDGLISLYEGDSIDVLKPIPDGTYSAVVTDPPYGLSAASNNLIVGHPLTIRVDQLLPVPRVHRRPCMFKRKV